LLRRVIMLRDIEQLHEFDCVTVVLNLQTTRGTH
jgi:hypothetical protein